MKRDGGLGLVVGTALVLGSLWWVSPVFVHGPVPRTGHTTTERSLRGSQNEFATNPEPETVAWSWAAPLLGAGAALGLLASVLAPMPASAITADQFQSLTYNQIKGSGLANRCPTVEGSGSIEVRGNMKMENMCFEPKSYAVEMTLPDGKTDFVNTRLMTRQTYSLEGIKGDMSADGGNIKFVETDGIDFAPTTVKLPTGEYQPFLFTVKNLTTKGEGSSLKPGFTMGGDFTVPSYRTGGFLDPKNRGMYTGYDQAVALPALQASDGQDELFKETNKVFDIGKGAIEMEVNRVNSDIGEIGGVFVSKQPSDTDMGAKFPKTILLKGIFYGKVAE